MAPVTLVLASIIGRSAALALPKAARLARRPSLGRRLSASGGAVAEEKKVPVTLLSGFLGAGKTSLLQSLLKTAARDADLKVGVVVNDMAAVNIDAKLMHSPFDGGGRDQPAEFVEIGDGCVCCTMADELFSTLAQLSGVSAAKGYAYDHIVVEATGVAEPRNLRDQFQDAEAAGMPLLESVALDTLVTVVDSAAFLAAYAETRPIKDRPDLAAASKDDPLASLLHRFDGSSMRAVVDLLVEQVECADVVLLNKADLVTDEQMARLRTIISALNANAKVYTCEHGEAKLDRVLAVAGAEGAAGLGPVDEHKVAVAASKASHDHAHAAKDEEAHSHAAKEEKAHAHAAAEPCADAACTDPTHDHSHSSHDHARAEQEASHDHSHSSHEHARAEQEDHASHDHGHSAHDHSDGEPCADAACTDPTHDHSHSGHDGHWKERFGIESFVYARRRPFAPSRLGAVLRELPADVRGPRRRRARDGRRERPRRGARDARAVKGFLWLASSHDAAYYWSHAGAFFNAELLGRWWATLPEERPEDLKPSILADFDGDSPDGDRRQEIVFIGADLLAKQGTIEAALDGCLLTDDELAAYRGADDAALEALFPSDLKIKA
ncbi:ATP binding protein [Aureococcus anophagefferens]|nr:ATP binding protein [Aureococcus anophagefferens]